MNEEKARDILECYIQMNGLPIYDEVLYEQKFYTPNGMEVVSWTFRGLIKFIYFQDDI